MLRCQRVRIVLVLMFSWVMLLGYRLLCIAVVSRVMIVPQTTPAILLVAVLYYGGRIRYVTPDAVLMLS